MRYKIACYDELYGKGGYYDAEVDVQSLQHIDPYDWRVSYIETVYPVRTYERSPPYFRATDIDFTETNLKIFNSVNESYRICSSSLAFSLKDCLIYNSVIYLYDNGDISVLYDSYRSNDRPYLKALDPDSSIVTVTRTLKSEGERLLYLSSVGSFNYGHWLIDDLPRIKWLIDNPQPTKIVLHSYPGMDEIRSQCLDLILADHNFTCEFINGDDVMLCEQIIYVTPVSFHPYVKNPAAMSYLRQTVRNRVDTHAGTPDRIYVMRRHGRGRNLVNHTEIEVILNAAGFVTIDPEGLSFSEQATVFANAQIVFGVMGAAMCNTVFCNAGTKIIYMAPCDWVEPFYWDLASTLDQNYFALHGPRSHKTENAPLDDFSIPPEMIKDILADLFN